MPSSESPSPMPAMPTPAPLGPAWLWKYVRGVAPAVLIWAIVIGWLAYLLYDRSRWTQEADEANLREWIDEARVFRKTLPELVREYLALVDARGLNDDPTLWKRKEIEEQLRAMADPTRVYQAQLPLFPEIYRLEIRFESWSATGSPPPEAIHWDSPAPRPRLRNRLQLQVMEYPLLGPQDPRPILHCEYRLHAFNKLQREEEDRRVRSLVVGIVVLTAGILAVVSLYRFLRRERLRERGELEAQAALEHAQRTALENELRRQEAERAREELDRKLLEQSLEAARQESRAAAAERAALELKSQLFASIGIMAGSYAHNIKNLLVRPNDLLARCIETGGLQESHASMLQEVRSTLGTVNERLQQILRAVRRDPTRTEMTRLDLGQLTRETETTWANLARDKWKLLISIEVRDEPLSIHGDLSHLQQAIENLLFNARDATFEMRNHLRDQAHRCADPAQRRRAILEANAWKGQVQLRAYRQETFAVLEVRDNGIGMTEEVQQNCLKTHFSTKRDNALFEGLNAGMGLGLSFVAVILEHHQATLQIESQPFHGATFRILFPCIGPARSTTVSAIRDPN